MPAGLIVALAIGVPARAQQSTGSMGDMDMSMPMDHDMSMMGMSDNPLGIGAGRDGSGTSWLPDASPMQGLMRHQGTWMLMLHGNAFVQDIEAGTDRGARQFGSVNWLMGMAERGLGGGQLQWRAMISGEALTVGRCGYPTLLASGEQCRGAVLHDQQHPHDLFMEVAARYRHALGKAVAFELYGGPAGEPALGPTAFPHRVSAMPNPIAPAAHHWLDSTHVSYGVATAGLYGRRWKAEASAFNGREPDDRRFDFDFGRLDSYSGRLWFLPTSSLAVQVSAGHLTAAEVDPAGLRRDVTRVTASLTHHRLIDRRMVATTLAWGQNRETDHATSAVLGEVAADVSSKDTLFLRGEWMQKTADELSLALPTDEPFVVGKVQAGYTRWLGRRHGLRAGLGGGLGIAVMPRDLVPFYGGRFGAEGVVYVNVKTE